MRHCETPDGEPFEVPDLIVIPAESEDADLRLWLGELPGPHSGLSLPAWICPECLKPFVTEMGCIEYSHDGCARRRDEPEFVLEREMGDPVA